MCIFPTTRWLATACRWSVLLSVWGVLAVVGMFPTAWAAESRSIENLIEATESPGPGELRDREGLLEQGERLYQRFCLPCHGARGNGRGNASKYLLPLPRDLSMGIFKFHSTKTNTLPLDEDLMRTIRRGVPGTAMPAWESVLEDEALRALVAYIKTFSRRFQMESPNLPLQIDLEPPFDQLSVQRGRSLYRELRCERCHGKDGERRGPLEDRFKDSWGSPSLVYDLRRPALYKAGASGEEIVRTLLSGMDGTPMSAYDYLFPDELWHLAHYLQSRYLVREEDIPPATRSLPLVSHRIEGEIDDSLDGPNWQQANPVWVPVMPLKYRDDPVPGVQVQSIHNGTTIAFRLQWRDLSPDTAGFHFDGYLDGAALQFAEGEGKESEVPFFGMGEKGKPVNIWHWKADGRQRGEPDNPSAEKERNRSGQGTAPGIFLDPFRESSLEEINSEGFGTLRIQSMEDQQVLGRGVWKDGRWQVVFTREMETPGPGDVRFRSKHRVLLAIALWNGSRKDRNASKLVSLWRVVQVE